VVVRWLHGRAEPEAGLSIRQDLRYVVRRWTRPEYRPYLLRGIVTWWGFVIICYGVWLVATRALFQSNLSPAWLLIFSALAFLFGLVAAVVWGIFWTWDTMQDGWVDPLTLLADRPTEPLPEHLKPYFYTPGGTRSEPPYD